MSFSPFPNNAHGSKRKRKDRKVKGRKRSAPINILTHSLSDVMLRDATSANDGGSTFSSLCPLSIDSLLNEICQHHLDTEGLFRTCGALAEVMPLVDDLRRGNSMNVVGKDSALLCSALKQILRDMHTGVFSESVQDALELAIDSEDTSVESMKNALSGMTCYERAMCTRMIGFLQEVSSHSECNKMPNKNLATVFAPTMLKQKVDFLSCAKEGGGKAAFEENERHVAIFKFLLDHAKDLFSEKEASIELQLQLDEAVRLNARTALGVSSADGNGEPLSECKKRRKGDFRSPRGDGENAQNASSNGFATPTRPSKRKTPLLRQMSRRASVRNLLKMTEDMAHSSSMQSPRCSLSHATKFAQKQVAAAASGSMPTRRRAPLERTSITDGELFVAPSSNQ